MKAALLLALVVLAGCSSPTAPTPPVTVQPPPIPSIAGQWTGTYSVLTCIATGSGSAGACQALGTLGALTLTPNQSGPNVSATLGIGIFSVPVTGTVGADNVVVLAGSGPVSFATLTVNTWRAVLNGSTMSGTMQYTVFADGTTVIVTSNTSLRR